MKGQIFGMYNPHDITPSSPIDGYIDENGNHWTRDFKAEQLEHERQLKGTSFLDPRYAQIPKYKINEKRTI